MARAPRQISRSGIYHVMLRGVNKQRIFENMDDYYAIYRILNFVRTTDTQRNSVEEPTYFLYAYCIMDNHIHLLIQPNGYEVGEIMKRVMTTYAIYFNYTYERVGHLFQDRFRSEPVEDLNYFYTLLYYIHHNPVNAGICTRIRDYRYTSMSEFLTLGTDPSVRNFPQPLLCFPKICSLRDMKNELTNSNREKRPAKPMMLLGLSEMDIRDYVLDMDVNNRKLNLREELEHFIRDGKSSFCRFLKGRLHLESAEEKDHIIVQTLLELTGTRSITEFQHLDKRTMRGALALVRDSGVSIRQLSRLTGISFSIIRTSYTDMSKEQE